MNHHYIMYSESDKFHPSAFPSAVFGFTSEDFKARTWASWLSYGDSFYQLEDFENWREAESYLPLYTMV